MSPTIRKLPHMRRRGREAQEIVNRLDRVIELITQAEDARKVVQQEQLTQNELESLIDRRWQLYLTGYGTGFTVLGLAVILRPGYTVGVVIAAIAFIMVSASSFGLINVRKSAQHTLLKRAQARASNIYPGPWRTGLD